MIGNDNNNISLRLVLQITCQVECKRRQRSHVLDNDVFLSVLEGIAMEDEYFNYLNRHSKAVLTDHIFILQKFLSILEEHPTNQ